VDQEAHRKAETERWITNNNEQERKTIAAIRSLEKSLKSTESTPADKADADQKAQIYYDGLIASVAKLDDGTSDAATVGKAAVSQNISKLREWKKAQLIHWWRNPAFRDKVESSLLDLPNTAQWDEATSAVLEVRQKRKTQRQ